MQKPKLSKIFEWQWLDLYLGEAPTCKFFKAIDNFRNTCNFWVGLWMDWVGIRPIMQSIYVF